MGIEIKSFSKIVLVVFALSITACAKVAYEDKGKTQNKVESTPVGDFGGEEDQPLVSPDLPAEEITEIMKNEGCQLLLAKASSPPPLPKNYRFNGSRSQVFAENALEVIVNGRTSSIGILGADEVVVNGKAQDICVVAKYIKALNGSIKNSRSAVLVGEDGRDNSYIEAINGASNSTIVIRNFTVKDLNGDYNKLILDNAVVGKINGKVRELHLSNNAKIVELDGEVGKRIHH